MKTSDRNTQVRFSEAKFILKQTRKLADERLVFMDGKRLGDVSIGIEDNGKRRALPYPSQCIQSVQEPVRPGADGIPLLRLIK